MAEKVLYNGEITGKVIGVNSESLFFNYGYGFSESILYKNNNLFFFDEHIKRLCDSVFKLNKSIDVLTISLDKILNYIKFLGKENETLRIKIIAFDNNEEKLCTVVSADEISVKADKNLSVWIDSQNKDLEIGRYKSLNYMHNLLRKEFFYEKAGVDEVLFLNKKERILEGCHSNIAIVLDKNIYLVDKKENYLDGVTQQQIEKHFLEIGFKKVIYKKRGIAPKMLRLCDEVILLNSLGIAQTVSKIYNGKKNKVIIPKQSGYSQKIRDYFFNM